MPPPTEPTLATRVLAWHARHGRHELPWTRERTPYRVWLSEIMLQQTQVQTVIPYFERFVARFDDVHALAAAPLDEVLHLWAGLGYYSRARNLHKAAQHISHDHNGEFPRDVATLESLPGIGRSTAGAIVALSWNERATILDGNVKRVLARHFAVAGWPGETAVLKQLWRIADAEVPAQQCRNYTQGMMDLGATLCTRRRPSCAACPLAASCAAYAAGQVEAYPGARPKRQLPQRHTRFLMIENADGAVLLTRRPASGIWGGLWSFPECDDERDAERVLAALGFDAYTIGTTLAPMRHTFTHFHLHITPVPVTLQRCPDGVREDDAMAWFDPANPSRLGLPKPVAALIKKRRATRT